MMAFLVLILLTHIRLSNNSMGWNSSKLMQVASSNCVGFVRVLKHIIYKCAKRHKTNVFCSLYYNGMNPFC